MYLDREYRKRNDTPPFVYHEAIRYQDFTLRQKVSMLTQCLILYYLCERQLDRPEMFKPVMEAPEQQARHWVMYLM